MTGDKAADPNAVGAESEADFEGAGLDDVEAVAGITTVADDGTGGDAQLREGAPDTHEVVRGEVFEERDGAEGMGELRRFGAGRRVEKVDESHGAGFRGRFVRSGSVRAERF